MPVALPPGVAFRPGTMSRDLAIERAVGIMVWAMTNTDEKRGRVMTEEEAIAKASNREPELTEKELAACMAWARGAIAARDACNVAPGHTRLCDILDKCGVPWREQ